METIQLTIPSMKSSHCMMVVSSTLKKINGATLKKVSAGLAEVELSGASKDSVVQAIENAGYTVINK